METTKLQFFRLDVSPYQSADFLENEKRRLSELQISPASQVNEAQILITNTHTNFEKLELSMGDNVELLIHPNSGYDNIPASFVKNNNFPIVTGNTIRAHGVTEYILSCVFKHYAPLNHTAKWEATRSWPRTRLADQDVLVLGKGLIGKKLIESLKPITKSISCYDPFKDESQLNLKDISLVLVAASLNKTSKGLIDKTFLSKLRPGAVIVNAARGKIINQADLVSFLKKDANSFAYLDVFEKEPFKGDEFSGVSNIQCTSHIAGVSENLDNLILDFEYQTLKDFLTHRSKNNDFLNRYSSLILKNKLSPDNSFLI